MYLSITFVLLIAGTSLSQVNGNWLRGVHSLDNQKRSAPNEITVNGDVKKCGVELQESEICSCRALICDGEQSCQYAFGKPRYGWRLAVACQLTKAWDQIDTQDASMGGPGDDCTCGGHAMMAKLAGVKDRVHTRAAYNRP